MIHFFRSLFQSKIGAFISLAFLALIAFAFIMSDISGGGIGGVTGGGTAAKIGRSELSIGELRSSMLRAYNVAKQQQPGLDQTTFFKSGAYDDVLKDIIDTYTLEEYARKIGLGVSKRLVDARIAENPAFAGLDGKFSQLMFQQALQQNAINEGDLRQSIERELLIEQLLSPMVEPVKVPASFARPYGDLLLEERSGLATFIPAEYYQPTAAPTTAQLTDYVTKNRTRYLVPEQRVVRYAVFDKAHAASTARVTDADIAKAYDENKAQFTASETRLFKQAIVPTEAQAKSLAAASAAQPLDTAATAIGLSASTINAKSAKDLALASNDAVAKAGFAATEGQVVGPIKIPLGWSVVKLEKIERSAAKTLAEARPEIEKELLARKQQEAVADVFNKMQDAADNGASVDEIAKQNGLTIVTTPAIFADGRAPADPAFKPDAVVAAVASGAFQASQSGETQIVTLKENEEFALVDAAKIIPSAVPALATIQTSVTDDWKRAEGAKKARELARKISDRVSKGETLDAAIKAEGAKTAPVQRIGGKRMDVTSAQGRIPPEIALLFSMAPRTSKTLEMPNNMGWMVIFLEQSKRGDATKEAGAIPSVQQQLGGILGKEYVDQVLLIARKAVGVKRNADAISQLKAELTGANQAAQ